MKFAFVFPGQGSQSLGMMAAYGDSAVIRAAFDEASQSLGRDLWQLVAEGPAEALSQTVNTQPLMLTAGVAVWRLWLDKGGMQPAMVAGHSLGEYSALVAAGAIAFRDAVVLVRKRGQYMQDAVPEGVGCMLALIGADPASVDRVVADSGAPVDVANLNAPGQVVIAGEREATHRVAAQCHARQVIDLPVSAPFHCRLMRPAEERLRADLAGVTITDPRIPLYNNVDARKVITAAEVRDGLTRQVSRTVRWTALVERMIADGLGTFVELGPGAILSGLIRRIDRNVERLAAGDSAAIATVRARLTA